MNGHIVISGTGRSGTTVLVQILTHLGFDTGFTPDAVLSAVDSLSHAGLERMLDEPDLPHVIKSPWFADDLAGALDRGLRVDTVIVPFRDLFSAAESRRRVYREAARNGFDPRTHPGSLWKVQHPDDQEDALARQFYKLIETVVLHNIPLRFLAFPRFVSDVDYFCDQLGPLFARHGIARERVRAAHAQLVVPSRVNVFTSPPAKPRPRG